MSMSIPKELKCYLGSYEVLVKDDKSGKPVAWGHKFIKPVEALKWDEFKKYGTVVVVERNYPSLQWGVITKYLTLTEAIEKHGAVKETRDFGNSKYNLTVFDKITFLTVNLKT